MKPFISPTQGYCVMDEAPVPVGDWQEVPERPAPHYVWDGEAWGVPTADARLAAHKRLSARRDAAIENFTFAGMPIRLTPETRSNITGAVLGVTVGQTQDVHWQVSPTQFIDLTAQQILALGIATHAHVEACFTNTRALAALVEASEDPISVDIEIGWP